MIKQAFGILFATTVIILVIVYPLYILVTEVPKNVVVGLLLTVGILGLGFFAQSVEGWYRISKETHRKETKDILSKS